MQMFIQADAAVSYIFTQKDINGSPCDILFKASKSIPKNKNNCFQSADIEYLVFYLAKK